MNVDAGWISGETLWQWDGSGNGIVSAGSDGNLVAQDLKLTWIEHQEMYDSEQPRDCREGNRANRAFPTLAFTSLCNPQSQDPAEQTVQTMKNRRLKPDGKYPYLSLLMCWNILIDNPLLPAQLLLSQCLHLILFSTEKQLEPETVNPSQVQAKATTGAFLIEICQTTLTTSF